MTELPGTACSKHRHTTTADALMLVIGRLCLPVQYQSFKFTYPWIKCDFSGSWRQF